MAVDKCHVLVAIWRTGVWKLMPFLLIYSIGFATVFPVIPTLVTNGFASEAAGYPVDCMQYPPGKSPPECDHAHTQAVQWSAWTSVVSGSFLSFVCAPAVGKMSDVWGRKPFLLAGVALALAPMLTLMVHLWGWCSIEWYYPMSALNGMVSSFALAVMIVADLLPQGQRAIVVGYLSACFSVGVMVGPALGGFIPSQMAVYVCIALIVVSLLYVLIFMPETAPQLTGVCDGLNSISDDTDNTNSGGNDDMYDPLLGGTDDNNDSPETRTPARQHNTTCSPASACGATAATAGDLLEFDVVPNVVPGAHEHAQLVVKATVCGSEPGSAPAPGACSGKQLHRALDSSPAGPSSEHTAHAGGAQPHAAAAGGQGACQSSGGSRQETAGAGKGGKCGARGSDMLVGWRIIRASAWYRKLVVVWIIVSLTFEGAQDLLTQYLQLRLSYNTADVARLLIVIAVCGLVIKLGALNALVRWLGEQWLLALGLTAYMLQNILLAVANTKLFAQAAVAVGSLACVCWPASVALQTRHVEPQHVGAVQGALHGISSLASGVGPLLFSSLFTLFTEPKYGLPRFPQVVWYTAAGFALLGVLVTATLHWCEHGEGCANIRRATSDQMACRQQSSQRASTAGNTAAQTV